LPLACCTLISGDVVPNASVLLQAQQGRRGERGVALPRPAVQQGLARRWPRLSDRSPLLHAPSCFLLSAVVSDFTRSHGFRKLHTHPHERSRGRWSHSRPCGSARGSARSAPPRTAWRRRCCAGAAAPPLPRDASPIAERPPPPSRTNWTHLVPPSVLNGHVSSQPYAAASTCAGSWKDASFTDT